MPDYQNGKIYKIEPIVHHDPEDVYYGGTIQPLSKRMVGHRSNFKIQRDFPCNSIILFKKYGLENCKIELIELFPCNSIEELNAREGYYIRNNDCINKKIAGRTRVEYYNDNRDRDLETSKKRYTKDKDRLTEKHNCECGGSYTTKNKLTHEKTKKHKKLNL